MEQPPGGEQPQPPPARDQPPPPPPPPTYAPPPPAPAGYMPPPPPGYGPPPPAPGAYQPPPPGFGPPGAGLIASPPTDQLAIWSLVLAALGLFGICACGVGGIIGGLIAFFMGGSALGRIRSSGGALGGDTLAAIGRWGGLAVAVLGLITLLAFIGLAATGSFPSPTPSPRG